MFPFSLISSVSSLWVLGFQLCHPSLLLFTILLFFFLTFFFLSFSLEKNKNVHINWKYKSKVSFCLWLNLFKNILERKKKKSPVPYLEKLFLFLHYWSFLFFSCYTSGFSQAWWCYSVFVYSRWTVPIAQLMYTLLVGVGVFLLEA